MCNALDMLLVRMKIAENIRTIQFHNSQDQAHQQQHLEWMNELHRKSQQLYTDANVLASCILSKI